MTTDEAKEVWSIISTVYGLHPERSAEQSTVWVPALLSIDVREAMSIVEGYMLGKGPDKLPTVVMFAKAVNERAAAARKTERAPHALESGLPRPPWYLAWEKMRANGDDRCLPEQEGGYRQLAMAWPPLEGVVDGAEYDALLEAATQVKQRLFPSRQEFEPTCALCRDSGLVETGYGSMLIGAEGEKHIHRYGEQMAPCPSCGMGKRLEYPLNGRGPWGEDGFWRGRKWVPVRSGVVEIAA